ncbi:MAG: hypothetical protein CMM02_03530 [Rhodopirellula sp.]|nr:hypothetical protein [Rhodopirellula sp.]
MWLTIHQFHWPQGFRDVSTFFPFELPLKVLLKPQRPGLAMPGLRSRLWAAPVLLQTLRKWD